MNLSTVIGIAVGALTLLIAAAFSGSQPSNYINLPGLVIVIGGTCAALLMAYPLHEIKRIGTLVRTVFRDDRIDSQSDIDELVAMAKLWMNDDIRKVERELEKVSNPFLRTGVQLIIDHTPEDQIIDLLQWRIARLRARERAEAHMFRIIATFAPAFGMLGTLVGLINLMTVLGSGSMDTIGHHLAVGLMTTFYGILLANMIAKPIAIKLERRTEQRVERMNLVLQGISMMCDKRGPSAVRATLEAFMLHIEDEIDDGSRTAKRAAETNPDEMSAAALAAMATRPGGATVRPAATPAYNFSARR